MTKVNLNRSDWQCYLDTPDDVIKQVNSFFTLILPDCKTPVQAQGVMYDYLDAYVEWGFLDSECCQVVTDVINKHFNSSIHRWQFMNEMLQGGTSKVSL